MTSDSRGDWLSVNDSAWNRSRLAGLQVGPGSSEKQARSPRANRSASASEEVARRAEEALNAGSLADRGEHPKTGPCA
jgi:hypothetical protein